MVLSDYKKRVHQLIFLSACLCLFSQRILGAEMNILFIGNSYTFRHELPTLVKTVFEEGQPGLTINVADVTYGGQRLWMHWEFCNTKTFIEQHVISNTEIKARIQEMQTLGNASDAELKKRLDKSIGLHQKLLANNSRPKWDYMVLQTWNDLEDPIHNYAVYAEKFADFAETLGIKTVLYITSSKIQNEAPVTGPQEPALADERMRVTKQVALDIKPFAVVNTVHAVNMIQKPGTQLTFRYVNDGHPNQRLAFLTSSMFYTAFFKQSTEGFNYNSVTESKLDDNGKDPDGGNPTVVFGNDEKLFLQRMAYRSVTMFDSIVGIDPVPTQPHQRLNRAAMGQAAHRRR
jgi:hypothetical protein